MKKMFMLARKNIDKTTLLITMILLIFSVLVVCQNSAFIFNPFILVLLCVSCGISFFSFISVGVSAFIVAFIIDKRYGVELLLIVVLFVLSYYISTLFKKETLRLYLPCFLSNIITFVIYLLTSDSAFYAINSIVLALLSLTFSFSIITLIDKKRKKENVDDVSLSLLITFILAVFIKLESILFIILIFTLVLLLKVKKFNLYLFTCFFSFFIIYLFSDISINVLMGVYLSLFVIALLQFDYNYYFFVPIISIFMFSINETFYKDQLYYQLLIGFLLVIFVPRKTINKVEKLFSSISFDNMKEVLNFQKDKLNDISHLCDLLMDDRFDKFEGLDKVLEKVIKKDVCSKCSSYETCNIKISKFLSGYLSNNEKNEIVGKCLYPYQLTKAISTSNKRIIDYSEREVKSVESKKIMNKAYDIIRKYIDLKPLNKKIVRNYSLDISFYSKEATDSPNGDALKIYNDEYQAKLVLSDGMGHTTKSKDISEYVIELINYLHIISNDVSKSIESCNQIILAKTYEEVYATLDLCDFDLEKGSASIYKAGSFPCYLIRNKTIREISTKLPPIGIIGNIKVSSDYVELHHNDILIFLTDGFGEQVKEELENTIQKVNFLPFKNYIKFLFNRLNKLSNVEDDKTIVGIKIIKN